jgi:hypothetical protein
MSSRGANGGGERKHEDPREAGENASADSAVMTADHDDLLFSRWMEVCGRLARRITSPAKEMARLLVLLFCLPFPGAEIILILQA